VLAVLGLFAWVHFSGSAIHPRKVPLGFPSDTTLYPGRDIELPGDMPGVSEADRSLIDRALEYRRQQKWDPAIELFEEAIRRAPNAGSAWYLAAETRLLRGDPVDTVQADSMVARALVRDGGHPWLLLLHAKRLHQSGKSKEAKETLIKALDFAPNFRPAMEELARLELKGGNLLRAQRIAQLSISLTPREGKPPYDLLAEILFARERDDSTREAVRIGMTIDPEQARYLWIRGLLAESRGDTTSARRDYENAISIGRVPEAQEALRTLGLKPIHGSTRLGTAYSGIPSKQIDFAVQLLLPLAKSYPNSAPIQYALGRAWQEQGYLAQADEAFRKALSIDSTVPGLVDWARENRTQLEKKAQIFQQAQGAAGEGSSVSNDNRWYDLGHYKLPWRTSREMFLSQFPAGRFEKLSPLVLSESKEMWGIRHTHQIRFDSSGMWAINVVLRDAGKASIDLLEEGIRLNALQAGSGNFNDPKLCPSFGQIESVWWQTPDTYEIMLIASRAPRKLGVLRIPVSRMPEGGLCALAPLALDTVLR
jgi:tetratricopeptide (TPR) repeat protein